MTAFKCSISGEGFEADRADVLRVPVSPTLTLAVTVEVKPRKDSSFFEAGAIGPTIAKKIGAALTKAKLVTPPKPDA